MYTNITRLNLEEAIQGDHGLDNLFPLIADKLRVIYTSFGWNEIHKDEADEVVESCTQNVLEDLLSEQEEAECGQAGLVVRGWWDEENLVLDYNFRL